MRDIFKIVLQLCALVISLQANAAFVEGGFNFEVTGEATVRVLPKWPNYAGAIDVPKTVQHDGVTYTVTAIAPQAFMNAEFVTSVKMHSTLREIGANAFENCRQIQSVSIPKNVTVIGSRAFAGCTALSSVKLNNKITEVANGLFDGCTSLKEVELTQKVKRICSYAFSKSALEKIIIDPAVTEIETLAFDGCSKLKVVAISDLKAWCNIDFHSLGDNPLRVARALLLNGDTLRYLNIPEGVTQIKKFSFVGINSYRVTFPSTLKAIDMSAFLECYFVNSVVIPNSVTEISIDNVPIGSDMPFPNASSLVLGTGLRQIPDNAFYNCYRLTKLLLLDGVEEIGHEAFKFGRFHTLVMPSSLRTLKSSFAGCTNLKSVTLNYRLSRIEGDAFGRCANLKEIHCLMPDPANVVFAGIKHFEGVDTETCVLYVPAASVNKYKRDPIWGVFRKILPDIPMPDVDRNGLVDVDDVNLLVNTMLQLENTACSHTAADVNHNGLVDIDDINITINSILGL